MTIISPNLLPERKAKGQLFEKKKHQMASLPLRIAQTDSCQFAKTKIDTPIGRTEQTVQTEKVAAKTVGDKSK